MADPVAPRPRAAILGGGLGSLTTAFELSSRGYDVTIYQLGWRLGGQGASGRNLTDHGRIEEHGLHIWFGFYHNAFRMMGQVYGELGRPPDHPLSTVERAFVGADQHLFLEHLDTGLKKWLIEFPHDDGFPGTSDGDLPDVHELLQRLVNFARDHFHHVLVPHANRSDATGSTSLIERLGARLLADVSTDAGAVVTVGAGAALEAAAFLAARVRGNLAIAKDLHRVLTAVASHLHDVIDATVSDDIRRAWIIIDLALTYARGFIADDVLLNGFKPLDKFEFREWLERNGAQDQAVHSAVVQAFYDASFSYADGRVDQPNVAAGVAVRATLRIIFGYVGHIVFKMNAGMGDTIFAPIYQVLKRRGVTFKFFHRVTGLEPGPVPGTSARGIARVHLARQVDLVGSEYEPLVQVNDLPCWPSTPLTDQIQNGDRLAGVNLESHWSGWPDVGTETIEAGRDFDVLVLGISLGGLPLICQALLDSGEPNAPAWRALFDQVKTVRTQAVQIWTHETAAATGWGALGGITACCDEPDASWADFSQVLDREAWPTSAGVAGLFYGCGPMPDTNPPIPPPDDSGFPAQMLASAVATSDAFLQRSAGPVWPSESGANGLDPGVVASRYDRVNIDPSERYVLAVAGGEFAKLPPDGSGYSNLYLTGCWVENGLNISSVEGTVMAGLAAAAAISGAPLRIVGAKDF
jgi:uncharacterized protein with NAD-binding domain and iron-sulfur cluster